MSRKARIHHKLLAIYPAGLTYTEIAVLEKVDYRRAYAEVQPLISSGKARAEKFINEQRIYAVPAAADGANYAAHTY